MAPHRPRLAPTAAAIAGFGAATVDVILLVTVASQLATALATLAAAPIALAAAARHDQAHPRQTRRAAMPRQPGRTVLAAGP
jgi:hypothetical protein